MHTEPLLFVIELKEKYPAYFNDTDVLEVGSLDVNGSVRGYFKNCRYLGIDIGEGRGVDKVVPCHEHVEPNKYDVVISTGMLEHDVHWQKSLKQMVENLKSGGIFIFTCAGPDFQEHGTSKHTPQDSPFTHEWYRNISIEDFYSIVNAEDFSVYDIKYMRGKADLLFYGIKK